VVWGAYGELGIEVQPASMRYGFPKAKIVEGDEMGGGFAGIGTVSRAD